MLIKYKKIGLFLIIYGWFLIRVYIFSGRYKFEGFVWLRYKKLGFYNMLVQKEWRLKLIS